MKKSPSKLNSKVSSKRNSKVKIKKEPKEEKKHNFIPDIEDTEEEKQAIKEIPLIEEIIDESLPDSLISIPDRTRVSLNKVNLQRGGGFNLENFIENSPINQTQKPSWQNDFDPMNYSSGIKNSDEPKYFDYGGNFNPVEKVNMSKLSSLREEKGSFQFNPMIKQEEKSIETYVPAERMNISELGKKKNNFIDSGKEIKYTPGKY